MKQTEKITAMCQKQAEDMVVLIETCQMLGYIQQESYRPSEQKS
jgi:hypothetical protein